MRKRSKLPRGIHIHTFKWCKNKIKNVHFSVVFDRANNNQCLISDHYRIADFVLVTCLFINWSVWRTSHVRYILYMRALAWPVPIFPFDRSIDRFVLSWLRTSHRSQIESSAQRNMRFICLFRFLFQLNARIKLLLIFSFRVLRL